MLLFHTFKPERQLMMGLRYKGSWMLVIILCMNRLAGESICEGLLLMMRMFDGLVERMRLGRAPLGLDKNIGELIVL